YRSEWRWMVIHCRPGPEGCAHHPGATRLFDPPRRDRLRVRQLLRRGAAVAKALVELAQQLRGGLGDHGAGRKDRLGARRFERVVVLWRYHAADHDHDVIA